MRSLSFEINGKTVEGMAAMKDGSLWVHLAGETFVVEQPQRGRRGSRGKSSGAHGNPGEIAAPMPGKIIKILAQKGDLISVGQVVLVMEAMKMEYTLKAQSAGALVDIRCSAGDQVTLGQVLAKIEEKK